MSRRVACALSLLAVVLATGCGGVGHHLAVGGGADASRAPAEIGRYGCTSCHTIAGLDSSAQVGPELKDFSQRRYIAGRLPNTPANLVEWIREPQKVDPGNVMPMLGVTPREARDIAAYLYSH
jgi:cytochrome c